MKGTTMTDINITTTLQIAEWVDTTLNETLTETLGHKAARALAVYRTANGLERVLVDADPDPYMLLTRLPKMGDRTEKPDAICLVMTGWMAKIADATEDGDYDEIDEDEQERIRVRVCAAINDSGVSTVVRQFGNDGKSDSFPDGGEGIFPEALKHWWAAIVATI